MLPANVGFGFDFDTRKRVLMVYSESSGFLTIKAWHQSLVGGQDMILRRTSALEYLQLFGGYVHENKIDVYARHCGEYESINYHVIDSFDEIDYMILDGVLCATPNQTFNEMLADYDSIDEQALIEALASYYFSHDESFEGLVIAPENQARFDEIRDWAVEYYDEI